MTPEMHSVPVHAGDLIQRQVEFTSKRGLVIGDILSEQSLHHWLADRLRQFALQQSFQSDHFTAIEAMVSTQLLPIKIPALKRVIRSSLPNDLQNPVQERLRIVSGGENEMNFVNIQYLVLQNGLSRWKKTPLDAPSVQHWKNICKMIAVAVIKGQKQSIWRQGLFRRLQSTQQCLGGDGSVMSLNIIKLPGKAFE